MKLGIIGTSDISSKAVLPYTNGKISVLAIAGRTYEKSQAFSKKYNIPKAYDNYIELLQNSEIDSVYIALPPALHSEWICKALSYGKNILVEKPMCLNEAQYKEIENQLAGKDKFILEGLMIQHHPWMEKVKEIVKTEKYGKILKCVTNITMTISPEMESGFRSNEKMGGGVVFDEAPYWSCIIQNIFEEKLTEIKGEILEEKKDAIWAANISGKIGCTDIQFYCSYNDTYSADFFLEMENALLCVRNFFRASMGDYKITIHIKNEEQNEKITFPGQNYYRNQLLYFYDNIKNPIIRNREMESARIRACLLEKVIMCLR